MVQSSSSDPTPVSARDRVIDATLALTAERGWSQFGLSDLAQAADVTLAELRALFPSKGAVIGAFMRRTDLQVLGEDSDDLAEEPVRERLFDLLMRRLDALAPYKAGLRALVKAIKRDPAFALALNGPASNSMRFMLEAAGIQTSGPLGALRVQGAVLLFGRVLEVWVHDDEPDLAKTMARLDRELDQAGRIIGRVEQIMRQASPLRSLCRRVGEGARARRRAVRDHDYDHDNAAHA
jgi:AcrR family transcriptional regulator